MVTPLPAAPEPSDEPGVSGRTHRVALVSSSYFPHPGGVEQHVRSVAGELRARGHDVVVWTVDRGEGLGVQVIDGVEVRYLPTPLPARSLRAVLRFLLALPAAARAWWRAYRDFAPSVLHVQCFGPNGLYAVLLADLTRTPLVVTSHGETFADDHRVFDQSALIRTGMRRALRSADVVTGCSQVVLDDLRDRFGFEGGRVIPNGVDLDRPSRHAGVIDRRKRLRRRTAGAHEGLRPLARGVRGGGSPPEHPAGDRGRRDRPVRRWSVGRGSWPSATVFT